MDKCTIGGLSAHGRPHWESSHKASRAPSPSTFVVIVVIVIVVTYPNDHRGSVIDKGFIPTPKTRSQRLEGRQTVAVSARILETTEVRPLPLAFAFRAKSLTTGDIQRSLASTLVKQVFVRLSDLIAILRTTFESFNFLPVRLRLTMRPLRAQK